jgi:hypothetical protein
MIDLIYCKKFCKCYNVPLAQQKKRMNKTLFGMVIRGRQADLSSVFRCIVMSFMTIKDELRQERRSMHRHAVWFKRWSGGPISFWFCCPGVGMVI